MFERYLGSLLLLRNEVGAMTPVSYLSLALLAGCASATSHQAKPKVDGSAETKENVVVHRRRGKTVRMVRKLAEQQQSASRSWRRAWFQSFAITIANPLLLNIMGLIPGRIAKLNQKAKRLATE